jgi:transcriptional regulator with XRE-family HTH domain
MVMTSSPTAWRRWLANEMRRKRIAAGLEQKEVAGKLRCTVTKVSYGETGARPFVLRDLYEILLPLYGVPESEWDPYLDACKRSKERAWWQYYDDDVVPDWLTDYIGLEQGASTLRSFELQFPHGLVQTTPYVTALMGRDPAQPGEDEVDQRIKVRETRRSVLSRPEGPVNLHTVMDEAILRRVVGGPDVMQGQLGAFVELAGQPNVTIQVLPFSRGPHPDLYLSFTILGFPWEDDPGVVYIEGRSSAEYLEAPHEVEDFERVFEHLCDLALPPEQSIAMIRQIAEEHR